MQGRIPVSQKRGSPGEKGKPFFREFLFFHDFCVHNYRFKVFPAKSSYIAESISLCGTTNAKYRTMKAVPAPLICIT